MQVLKIISKNTQVRGFSIDGQFETQKTSVHCQLEELRKVRGFKGIILSIHMVLRKV